MLLLGGSVMTLAWIMLALSRDQQASWMAPLAAVQISWMLHLGTLPRGPLRIAITVGSVLLISLLAHWCIIAGRVGMMVGLDLFSSAARLGPHLAWTYAQLFNGLIDLLWIAAALATGWWLARSR